MVICRGELLRLWKAEKECINLEFAILVIDWKWMKFETPHNVLA